MMNYHKVACCLGSMLIAFAFPAYAGYPQLTADAFCDADTGEYKVQYEATTWSPNCETYNQDKNLVNKDVCSNNNVVISYNGGQIANGAFTESNGYLFSGTPDLSFQPGDVVTVMAVAAGDWGPNYLAGGQSASTQVTVEEDPECTTTEQGVGRFTGGGHFNFADLGRITFGLTVHCDLLLSNNIEINWKEGNKSHKFHMTDHIETLVCSDDPEIIQTPPKAPLDTLTGIGTGKFNNQEGYTLKFTFVDGGEPGRDDRVAFKIYETDETDDTGNVILDTDGLTYLEGGNLQAHYDQPHKNKQSQESFFTWKWRLIITENRQA